MLALPSEISNQNWCQSFEHPLNLNGLPFLTFEHEPPTNICKNLVKAGEIGEMIPSMPILASKLASVDRVSFESR